MITKTILYIDNKWSEELPDLDSDRTLIIIFGAPEYYSDGKPFEQINKKYPKSKIMGCSTAGEISGENVYDNSLVVSFTVFESTRLELLCLPISEEQGSFEIGKKLATSLNRDDLKGIFLLSDGLNINGSAIINGINSILSRNIPVTGGLAGDGANFSKTWVLKNGRPVTKFVSGVGFYGDKIEIKHGSRGGWDIFGPERFITKSKDNIVYEIDGRPALELYKLYLGEDAKNLPSSALLFPLQIRSSTESKALVRTILSVNEADNSLVFAGDVPEGSLAQFMKANFDRLIDGAVMAAEDIGVKAKNFNDKNDILCIAISCVGRRLVLGQRTEEELEAIKDYLPNNTVQVGFYSYGELSPFVKGAPCELHNQTMTLTLIMEKNEI